MFLKNREFLQDIKKHEGDKLSFPFGGLPWETGELACLIYNAYQKSQY